MWRRKNSIERGVETIETNAVVAVDQLAERIRERLDNETGEQLAATLTRLAERVDALDLASQMQRSRKELRKAAKQAGKQVERSRGEIQKAAKEASKQMERSSQQLAAIGSHAVPTEPSAWIGPTLLGFIFGFGIGFLISRVARSRREEGEG